MSWVGPAASILTSATQIASPFIQAQGITQQGKGQLLSAQGEQQGYDYNAEIEMMQARQVQQETDLMAAQEQQGADILSQEEKTTAGIRVSETAFQGAVTQAQLTRSSETLRATQEAMFSKAGVLLDGSPIDVMLRSATDYEFDKSIERYDTALKISNIMYDSAVADFNLKYKTAIDLYNMKYKSSVDQYNLRNQAELNRYYGRVALQKGQIENQTAQAQSRLSLLTGTKSIASGVSGLAGMFSKGGSGGGDYNYNPSYAEIVGGTA